MTMQAKGHGGHQVTPVTFVSLGESLPSVTIAVIG